MDRCVHLPSGLKTGNRLKALQAATSRGYLRWHRTSTFQPRIMSAAQIAGHFAVRGAELHLIFDVDVRDEGTPSSDTLLGGSKRVRQNGGPHRVPSCGSPARLRQ